MKDDLATQIRRDKPLPIVGVVGATVPSRGYEKRFGIDMGYALREEVEASGGSIFTGGVSGVGVDAYIGVLKYCIDQASRRTVGGKQVDDRFFLLVPKYDFLQGQGVALSMQRVEYVPPASYRDLACLSPSGELDIVRAGNDMAERRQYVASISDALVMLNGGFGTLDETLSAIRDQTPVVVFPQSGGASAILHMIQQREVPKKLEKELTRQGFRNLESVDMSLVYPVQTLREMRDTLQKLY